MNDSAIEEVLHRAPRPKARAGLKQRLLDDISVPLPQSELSSPSLGRRWPLVWSFGCLLLAGLILVGAQTKKLVDVHRENVQLQHASLGVAKLRQEYAELQTLRARVAVAERAQTEYQELLSLRADVDQLQQQLAQLPALQNEQNRLLAQRTTVLQRTAMQKEEDSFAANGCVHRLMRIGLAARIWKNDHGKKFMPPDFLSVAEELGNPALLVCPSDTNHVPARGWALLSEASISYQLISPGTEVNDPDVVFTRCPIHNHVGLIDGSAQRLNPEVPLITVDGKTKIGRTR